MSELEGKERFFTMAATYDKMCRLMVPFYDLLQDEIFNIIEFNKDDEITVMDLGVGSGILLEKFLEKFPRAKCIWIDYSEDFLKTAKSRFENYEDRINYILCKLEENWEDKIESKPDIIVSSSAIHHLENKEKNELYKKCYKILKVNGWFFNIDEMKTKYNDAYFNELKYWYSYVLNKKSEIDKNMIEFYEKWTNHFENWKTRNIDNMNKQKIKGDDIHEYFLTQLEWLNEAGFINVNLFFKYHLWNLIGGKKYQEISSIT